MTALRFSVLGIAPEPYAVAPNLVARLGIEEATGAAVHAMLLRCQVRIEPQRRRYDELEERGLLGLFGGRERWADTLRPFTWLHAASAVQGFTGGCEAELVLPCSYDVEVAGATYFQSLGEGGEVPLTLLFSGTVFSRGPAGFAVEPIAWSSEASYRLPVRVWRELMNAHFPGQGWLRLRHETLAALGRFRAARQCTGWDETLTALLADAGAGDVAGEVAR